MIIAQSQCRKGVRRIPITIKNQANADRRGVAVRWTPPGSGEGVVDPGVVKTTCVKFQLSVSLHPEEGL